MKRRSIAWLATLLFLFGTTSVTWAQNCANGGMRMPSNLPGRSSTGMTPPPHHSQTLSSAPVRHVDVPVPNYARCGNNNYGYGAGGYYYGYGGYGYGGVSYGVGTATPLSQPSQRRARSSNRVSRPAPPDPRSARNYELRKALNKFARENSVGGRLYVACDDQKWLLEYDGTPSFEEGMATIPCIGKTRGGEDRRLTLTLHFGQGDVIADVQPRG